METFFVTSNGQKWIGTLIYQSSVTGETLILNLSSIVHMTNLDFRQSVLDFRQVGLNFR